MPIISVIVPVYNAEKYLNRCLDSILAQTFMDFDLILVDDGSPDNSGKICDEYAKKDNRVCTIHKKNNGVASARNVGIEWSMNNSDSEWITFIDSDDYVFPEFLEILYVNVINYNAEISIVSAVTSSIPTRTELHNSIKCFDNKGAVEYLFQQNNYKLRTPWAKLIKKSIVAELLFPETLKCGEDFYIVHQWVSASSCVVDSGFQLYFYNQDNLQSITNTEFSKDKTDELIAYESILFALKKKGLHSLFRIYLEEYIFKIIHFIKEAEKTSVFNDTVRVLRRKLRRAINVFRSQYDFNHYSQKNYILRIAYPKSTEIKRKIRRTQNHIFALIFKR